MKMANIVKMNMAVAHLKLDVRLTSPFVKCAANQIVANVLTVCKFNIIAYPMNEYTLYYT